MSLALPVKRTEVTLAELARCIWLLWPEAEIIDVAILFGKLIAECGWPTGKQACWNWNLGNIRGKSKAGNFHILGRAYEIARKGSIPKGWYEVPNTFGAKVPEGMVCVLPVDPELTQAFRAYDNLEEAVAEYLEVLKQFRSAWVELYGPNSDPARFILALKAGFYFTGDAAQYIINCKAGVAAAMPLLARMERPERAPDTLPETPTGKSTPRFKAVFDPGTGSDDWRPQTDAKPFLDTLVTPEDKP